MFGYTLRSPDTTIVHYTGIHKRTRSRPDKCKHTTNQTWIQPYRPTLWKVFRGIPESETLNVEHICFKLETRQRIDNPIAWLTHWLIESISSLNFLEILNYWLLLHCREWRNEWPSERESESASELSPWATYHEVVCHPVFSEPLFHWLGPQGGKSRWGCPVSDRSPSAEDHSYRSSALALSVISAPPTDLWPPSTRPPISCVATRLRNHTLWSIKIEQVVLQIGMEVFYMRLIRTGDLGICDRSNYSHGHYFKFAKVVL